MTNNENRWTDISNGVAWSIILSVAAVIMSICSLARNSERVLGFDYLGVIVGILALLVTFLVGWQIAQSLVSREQLRNLDAKIHAQTNRAIHINMYHTFLYQGVSAKTRNDNIAALDCFMRSLDCAKKCNLDDNKIDEVIQHVLAIINSENTIRPQINPRDCRMYEKIVRSCNHIDTNIIISGLNSCMNDAAQSQTNNWTRLDNPINTGLAWNFQNNSEN